MTKETKQNEPHLVVDPKTHKLRQEGLGEAGLDQLPVWAAQRRLEQTLAHNLARKLIQLQLQVRWSLGVRVNLETQPSVFSIMCAHCLDWCVCASVHASVCVYACVCVGECVSAHVCVGE